MDASDHDIVDRYRHGEVGALEILVERYRRPLYAFILNMTEGREDADEIFQEVWFRVIKKIDRYRKQNFFGWIVRIARNLIIDRARRRKPGFSLDEEREDGHSAVETFEAAGPHPGDGLEASELGEAIREAVDALPREQREVFVLRVTTEVPFKEIARIQKVSINTALARMHYALNKLRPLLQDEYDKLGRPDMEMGGRAR